MVKLSLENQVYSKINNNTNKIMANIYPTLQSTNWIN